MFLFLFIFLSFSLLSSLSPLKLSFYLVCLSIIFGFISYLVSNSIFSLSAVVISFSSGMMILFCYCSILVNYETKGFSVDSMLMSLVLIVIPLSTISTEVLTFSLSSVMLFLSSSYILGGMVIVILSMVAINKILYSPLKSLLVSY